jgi:hypothetical protein
MTTSLTLIVLAGFYEQARHAITYINMLAHTMGGQLVLLHVNRAGAFDPYDLAWPTGEDYRREELARRADTI